MSSLTELVQPLCQEREDPVEKKGGLLSIEHVLSETVFDLWILRCHHDSSDHLIDNFGNIYVRTSCLTFALVFANILLEFNKEMNA